MPCAHGEGERSTVKQAWAGVWVEVAPCCVGGWAVGSRMVEQSEPPTVHALVTVHVRIGHMFAKLQDSRARRFHKAPCAAVSVVQQQVCCDMSLSLGASLLLYKVSGWD